MHISEAVFSGGTAHKWRGAALKASLEVIALVVNSKALSHVVQEHICRGLQANQVVDDGAIGLRQCLTGDNVRLCDRCAVLRGAVCRYPVYGTGLAGTVRCGCVDSEVGCVPVLWVCFAADSCPWRQLARAIRREPALHVGIDHGA